MLNFGEIFHRPQFIEAANKNRLQTEVYSETGPGRAGPGRPLSVLTRTTSLRGLLKEQEHEEKEEEEEEEEEEYEENGGVYDGREKYLL